MKEEGSLFGNQEGDKWEGLVGTRKGSGGSEYNQSTLYTFMKMKPIIFTTNIH
jgi:hypothetical protein